MTDHLDRFHAALTVLAGHGHIKQRLIKAFEDNLLDIHEDELPVAMKQPFADLRQEMFDQLLSTQKQVNAVLSEEQRALLKGK